jgi:hypothetical protein
VHEEILDARAEVRVTITSTVCETWKSASLTDLAPIYESIPGSLENSKCFLIPRTDKKHSNECLPESGAN